MRSAEVILDIPTQALDAPYTYAVPSDMDEVDVGCAVLVPLGARKAIGFVMSLGQAEEAQRSLKPVERVLSKPYFNEMGALCARFLSERYVAPLSVCIRLFTPPGAVPRLVRDARGGWRLEEPAIGEVDDRWVVAGPEAESLEPRKNAVKQIAVLDAVGSYCVAASVSYGLEQYLGGYYSVWLTFANFLIVFLLLRAMYKCGLFLKV